MTRTLLCLILLAVLAGASVGTVCADGTNNPPGPTGEYNGSVTTAGSYDPYTGNGKRIITDLSVTGAVGAYPLKWTRVLNTRGGSSGAFGQGGQWAHSYQWGLWLRRSNPSGYTDIDYDGPDGGIDYPDGRTVALQSQDFVHYDPLIPFEGADRVVPNTTTLGGYDLLLRDGGQVHFEAISTTPERYDLRASFIKDPSGQVTLLEYDGSGRLVKVTEPGGRFLQLNWITYSEFLSYPRPGSWSNINVISSVQAYSAPGNLVETVNYTYTPETVHTQFSYITWYNLTRVDYADGAHASYTYFPSTYISYNGQTWMARVASCDDVRFDGPMKQIKYEYLGEAEYPHAPIGVVRREKNLYDQTI